MTAPVAAPKAEVARFRAKLLVAMMLVVATITAVALYLAQRNVAAAAEQELQRAFQGELAALHNVQELRQAALVERCRALVRRPRIHAALEDDALDLLYPSARDELRDLLANDGDNSGDAGAYALRAEFYRFLDRHGAVISPTGTRDAGSLLAGEEAQLALPRAPERQQLGYVVRRAGDGAELLSEVIAMPIISTETGEVIAALVLGFKPAAQLDPLAGAGIRRGIWLDGALHLAGLPGGEQVMLASEVTRAMAERSGVASSFRREIEGAPHLLFYNRLNAGSLFPAAYEVCLYPLAEMHARQLRLRWQVLAAAGLLLLVGYAASHPLAVKLSRPVENWPWIRRRIGHSANGWKRHWS